MDKENASATEEGTMDLHNNVRDVNGNVRRWYMTQEHIERLEALAKEGASLTAAAKDIGVDRKTLTRGAAKLGREEWLKKLFPPTRKTRATLKRKTPAPNMNQLYMKAATAAWR